MRISPIRLTILPLAALLGTSCSKPQEPDVALRTVIQEVAQGRASAIWKALPTSYQRDVAEVFESFADKLDPEVYDQGFALARQFLKVLRQTPGSISDAMPPQLARAPVDEHADAILDLFEELTTSQFSTVAGIQSLDIESCFDATGRALLDMISGVATAEGKDLDGLLKSIQVAVQQKADDGQSCVLKLSSTMAPLSFSVPFELVDGRWVPRSMARGWPQTIDRMRTAVAELPSMKDAANKKRMLGEIAKVKQQLTKLESAASMTELRDLMQQMARPPK